MKEDKRLIKGLKNGNKEVFEEIYRLYYIPLCNYCSFYVGPMEDAEEIVQNLFLHLWVKRSEIHIRISLQSYLHRSVKNEALNYLHHQKLKQKYVAQKIKLNGNSFPSVQHTLENEELEILIRRSILKLPENRRKIFEMSRFEGLKYTEIAKKLSVSVKTVETQMGRSLKVLREALKDYLPVVLMFTTLFCMLRGFY